MYNGFQSIEDYDKNGGLGAVLLFCGFYHDPLHA